MDKGVVQGKQLVLSVADAKNCRFPVKIKIFGKHICYCVVEIGGKYKCGILISYNEMCYLEDLHNSVNQYFLNNQHMIL